MICFKVKNVKGNFFEMIFLNDLFGDDLDLI
jgi:hypothetical protein